MVVGLVLLYLGFNFLKGIDFLSSRKKYFAVYENVDQLMPSNQIFLSGVSVGRVSKIQIDQRKGRVVVEMEIDSYVQLTDATVAILNGDFLGTKFIQLNPGNPGNGKKTLNPKDTLRSEVAKGITDFLEENAAPVTNNLQSTLGKLNKILDDLGRNTDRLDGIFKDLEATPKLLNRTLANADGALTDVSGNVKTVSENLKTTLAKLNPTLDNFNVLSDSLKQLQLNGTISKLQQSLTKLNETLGRFNKGDNTVSKLMTEDTLYVNLNKLLVSLDSLSNHLNQNPKHFLGPLGKSRKKIERDLRKQEEEKSKQ